VKLNTRESNLIRTAELYYEHQLSQTEIAKKLRCSRSTVSRMLAEALESGIVHITIRRPVEKFQGIADQIKGVFGLKEVIVVEGGMSNNQALKNVGYAGAEYLSRILKPDTVIGISFGVTLHNLVDRLDEFDFDQQNIEIVQLMGGLGSDNPAIDGPELARRMAVCLDASYRYIQAPAVIETPNLANQLMQEKYIAETIAYAEKASITISSVGSLADNLSSMERSGYLAKENRSEYQANGAIGHSLGRLIDDDGKMIDHPYNDSVVGVSLDVIKTAKYSIGIGANPMKAPVFIAAIKGGHFNVLIIDDGTAREILRLVAN